MSLILDALKKLEQEKASRKSKPLDLGPAILRDRAAQASSPWRLIILIVIAVGITAASTILLMNFARAPQKRSVRPEVSHEEAANAVPLAASAVTPPKAAYPATLPSAPVYERHAPTSSAASVHSTPVAQAPEPVTISAPELNVSGIAWQEDRSGRRAVVNGSLVSEGSVVAGARVKEIQPDRVRFSIGNRQFEITNNTPFH